MFKPDAFTGGDFSLQFVLNDFDPHVFARDLLIWNMLEVLTQTLPTNTQKTGLYLNTIYYVFCAPIMPAATFEHLQKNIERAIEMLEDSKPLPKWLDFPSQARRPVIEVLKSWKADIPSTYDVKAYRMRLMAHLEARPGQSLRSDEHSGRGLNKKLKSEEDCFAKTLLLLPHPSILDKDAALREEYVNFIKSPDKTGQLKTYLDSHWEVNPTLINLADEVEQSRIGHTYPEPYRLWRDLYMGIALPSPPRENLNSLCEFVTPFFEMVVTVFRTLKHFMKVEINIGDVDLELAKMRYCENPATFDRIHLSNIPDYLGMSLFTFQYALPLLKNHDAAFVTWNCLTTPPRWKAMAEYNTNSVLLSSEDDLARAFDAKFVGFWEDDIFGTDDTGYDGFKYFRWRRKRSSPLQFEELLPRFKFNHWVYSMFLHAVLPPVRGGKDAQFGAVTALVIKPLTLVAFIRLLLHLHDLGYPSHWLAEVLTNVLTDDVVTSARFPQKEITTTHHMDKRWPLERISTSAWFAEISTLATQFARTLPFALIVNPGILPEPQEIHECVITWKSPLVPALETAHEVHRPDWILLFVNTEAYKSASRGTASSYGITDLLALRNTLADPITAEEARGAVHIISTWTWNEKSRTATCWLRDDVLDDVRSGHAKGAWRVGLWRTDTWLPYGYGNPFVASTDIRTGRCWSDVQEKFDKQ
jgi:hypothetical protein